MIHAIGPLDARIMLVGEAAGEREEIEGVPFVGMAGRVLDSALAEVGIKREDCYITNVMLTRPEGNDFGRFYQDKGRKTPSEDLQAGLRALHASIKAVNPNVVVALGEEAMRAVTGLRHISDWRGSVVVGLTGHKVIPTFHPAAVSREWTFRPALICDLRRVAENAGYPDIRQKARTLVVAYKFEEAVELLKDIQENARYVAFDIETESEQITCIGLSPSHRPDWAVCIPFWFGSSGSLFTEDQEQVLWTYLHAILTSEKVEKFAQNGMYDVEFIKRTMGFDVRGFTFDTMLAFHLLYAELPKALSFLVSLYTDHPYYKDDIKSPSMDTYFKYNATDACLTMEIALKLKEELREANQEEFYKTYTHSLVVPLLAMQEVGVRFDGEGCDTLRRRTEEEIEELRHVLNSKTGIELNVNSPKQMKEWLYGNNNLGLGLKVRTKKRKATGETTVAADEEAIESLYAETKDERLRYVLDIRTKQKLLGTYLNIELDKDKRIRCSYLIAGTETGRLASRSTARGTGTNLQNIPAGEVRSLFIPDEGKVFINADLSQAEARVVAYLSGDDRLIRVFEQGGDIHRKNAANIFGVEVDAVTDEQRQLAKRVVHASNYGMGPRTFAKQCGIKEAEATRLLNQYFATYPGIKMWQQRTAGQVNRTRRLITPLGRKRQFFGRWADSLSKEAYAFVPQSTVADILNKGLVCLHAHRSREGMEILLQVHDSLLVQCRREMLTEGVQLLKECLTVPVEIDKHSLTIPVDIKIGDNWDALVSLREYNLRTAKGGVLSPL